MYTPVIGPHYKVFLQLEIVPSLKTDEQCKVGQGSLVVWND